VIAPASFFARIEARAREIDSLLCVGLDPHPADLPHDSAAAARDACLRLMEATAAEAVAFKPNSAFFERYGAEGMAALAEVIAAAPPAIPVLLDAKRGDIASTAEAYAAAAFETLGADALTVNPYLGYDSVSPFLQLPGSGVFLLCKTSNLGSADFQDLRLADGRRLYEAVAAAARGVGAAAGVGAGFVVPDARGGGAGRRLGGGAGIRFARRRLGDVDPSVAQLGAGG
jgi:uridine monophosphate synthetase